MGQELKSRFIGCSAQSPTRLLVSDEARISSKVQGLLTSLVAEIIQFLATIGLRSSAPSDCPQSLSLALPTTWQLACSNADALLPLCSKVPLNGLS